MSANENSKRHLTKDERFPRLYKIVERILKDVKNNKGSIKSIIYSQRVPRKCFNRVYGMAHNVLIHRRIIDNVIKKTKLLIKEPAIREEAAEIMIYEMGIRGTTLPGCCKPVVLIQKYSKEIADALEKLQKKASLQIDQDASVKSCPMPRYARINTLSITVEDALYDLEYNEYVKVEYDENISLDDYYDLVLKLEPWHFVIDYHFKDLLVFASGENLNQLPLYTNGHLFLQNKASLASVCALAPEPGSTVLDACAAPGMKTSHLACMMNNSGLIYAVDSDKKRFKTLESILEKSGVTNCIAACKDFTSIDPNEEPYSSVEYILVDPTCSGSGMVSRMDEVTDNEDSKSLARIQGLARLQIVLLKHALLFPNVKRVVYSTCSTTEDENEYVVEEVLQHYGEYFKVVPVMPEWPVRGLSKYEHGDKYFRSYPKETLTNGFFVALLEKVTEQSAEHVKKKKKKKKSCDSESR